MAGTLAPLVLGLSPLSDTGLPLDGLTRRNGVDITILGLNALGGPITIFDDRDGNGVPGSGEILTTVPAGLLGTSLGAVRVNLAEGTHNLRATQTTPLLGTSTSLPLQVRIDNTGPTILAVSQLDTPDPLGLLDLLGVLRYEVTFSEPVLGLSADLFQATGTLPGIHLVTLLPSLTKPNTYIVSVGLGLDGISFDQRAGTLGLALNPSNLSGVTDLAGNGLRGADFALLAPVNIGPARETATADFNADGLGDAAFLVNNTVVVTRGTGTGSLGATQTVSVAAGQNTIATGEVTGDGLVDIVTAGNGTVQILKQGTDGTFTVTSRATSGADGALIADVNGDGYADIVIKSLSGTSATVLTNNGSGSFSAGSAQSFGVRPDAFVSGDFNGDGRVDLAALANGGTQLAVLTQAANGTFTRSTLTVGASAGGLAAGDLNGDGRAEIVSAGTAGTLEIRGSTAAGAAIQTTLQAGAAATDIRIGDANGDGKQDILYAGTDGNVRVVYGDGAGNFSAPVVLETQAGLGALALLDINGDGRQDLALASGTTGTLQVGTGIPLAGVLGTAYDIVAPAPVQTVTAVRVAGDNIVNIAEAAAGAVPVTGTLSGPLGTGESLAVRIGGTVTPLAGAVVVTTNGATTFTGTIPALQASGDVAVLVQRTDGAASVALTQAVTVDLAAPALVSVTSPDGAFTKDTVIDFTLTFSEPVTGLTAANLGLTGTAAAGLVPTVTTTDGGRTYLVTVPAATAEGTLGLTLNPAGVRDAAGNLLPGIGVPAPVGPVLTLDHTAPVLTLQPITGDGIVSQADIAGGVVLAGTAIGLEAGASVMVTVTNATGTPVLTTTAAVANGTFSLPLTGSIGTTLTDGAYVVSIAAMDAAGNVAAPAVANLTVDLTADAGAPVAIALGNGRPIGLAGVAAVPLAVTGLDAGATAIVTFTDAGNHVVTKTVGVNGSASVDLSGLNGAVTSSIHITDTVGNTATLPGPAALIDTVAPLGTGLLTPVQLPGTVQFDVTFPEAVAGLDATDFQVVGTGSILGNVVQAVANPAGGYTVVIGNLSGAGTLGLALSATSNITDAAGNAATLGPVTPVALDLVPPPMPVITGLVSDGGVPGGFLTADTTPTLAGTAEAGSTVTVSYQGPAGTTGTLTAVAGVSGAWTATVPGALADGSYAFTATAADASGNVSLPASTKVVTIETATGIPFTLAVGFGDGLVNGTEAAAVTYTLGGLPAGASLSVIFTDADGTTASALLTDQGGTLNLSTLDGPVTSTLTYVPPAGQTVTLGGPGATFDTVAPVAPAILGFANAGNLPATITNDATPILIGTGEAGSTVTVEVGGQSLSAMVDASGTWRIPVTTPLTDGTVTLTASAQDAAGNSSAVLPGVPVTIDLQVDAGAPILVGLALPADRLLNAVEAAALTGTVTGIDADATATLTFTGSSGTVTVPLANGPLAATDLSGFSGTVTASVAVVDLAGNRATLPIGHFTVDATAPAATIVAAPAAAAATSATYTVTFPEAVANLTVDDFALTGTGTAAGTLSTVTEVGGVYTVTVTGITGTGSLALGLAAGSNIADLAGNPAIVAQAGLHLVNIPVVVPPESLPVITGITEDTGIAGDFVTHDASPLVSGTALAGGTVTLTYTGPTGIPGSLSTTVDAAGQWSVALPVLGDGPYTLSATLTDGANTVLGVSTNHALVIDTTADAGAPVVLAVSGTADNLVNAAEAMAVSYTVAGLDAGSTATAHFVAGALVKDVPVAADGTFTVDLSGFDGVVATSLIVGDLAGNVATIPGNSIRVATAVTTQPSVAAVLNDTGVDGDGITSETTPVLSGTAEAGSTVSVVVNGPAGPVTVQTTTGPGGAWTASVPNLADGAYTVTASATGASGLPSPASSPFALTIDTSADTAPLVAVQFASADTRLGAGEAGNVGFTLTGLDTGSSGTIAFTDGVTTVSVPVGTNGTYTADLSSLSGSVTAKAILADVAGNTVTADLSLPAGLTVDTVAPLGSAVADLAGGPTVASFTYAVGFSETVANVTANDFVLTGTNGVTAEVTSVTGSGGSYV
ncbi:beta strand repeat-containing protein, partial [Methylobacterium sp. J-090]|uniref:beta strand repeat-containing protein n=1 Tax=Methylobacterium sp. J-090 TaxID=2836666 RepID=UPI0024450422